VAKWESVLNDSILNFISDLINESEEFLNTEIETQVKSVQDKAKEVATAIGAGVVDDIYKTV
jgi:enamine deaminase RidA (YjgF/YER057c/UK114 family)